ncbi:MAG: hypothetical protein ACLFVI_01470 [Archaeoglobaceae archaeon]
MEFEKQYRIFIASFILGMGFYVFGEAITGYLLASEGIQDLFWELGINSAWYMAFFLLSLFLLGGLKSIDVHLIGAHLTLLVMIAIYGIFLTLDNLSFYFNSQCLLCTLPFHIPYYIGFLKTRHLAVAIPIIITLIRDLMLEKEKLVQLELAERMTSLLERMTSLLERMTSLR